MVDITPDWETVPEDYSLHIQGLEKAKTSPASGNLEKLIKCAEF